jgi:hypothetical protein
MLALQRMTKENIPLQEYVVSPIREDASSTIDLIGLSNQVECLSFLDQQVSRHSVGVPDYVKNDSVMDLSHATEMTQYRRPEPRSAAGAGRQGWRWLWTVYRCLTVVDR